MALNVKQKYPGTQGGAAQLYASDTRLSLKRREQVFTRLSKIIQICHKVICAQTPTRPAALHSSCLASSLSSYFSVDASWRISSSSLRMCARQDCFVFERPQVVFYCNFSSSRHVSKSADLICWIVFDSFQTKKMNPRCF